jgi:transposase
MLTPAGPKNGTPSPEAQQKQSSSAKRYPPELKEQALRLVFEAREHDPGDAGIVGRIARQLGIGDQSLRNWVNQADIDRGKRAGLTTEERAELKRLQKENRELKRSNEILRRASAYFAQAELDRPWK